MKSEVLALAGGLIILHRHGWSMGEMGNSLVPIERAMYNSLTRLLPSTGQSNPGIMRPRLGSVSSNLLISFKFV